MCIFDKLILAIIYVRLSWMNYIPEFLRERQRWQDERRRLLQREQDRCRQGLYAFLMN